MFSAETAITYLATWAWHKARNAADREVDGALEQALDRLHAAVETKLTGDPGLRQLELQAASSSTIQGEALQSATVRQMQRTLTSAARSDPRFEAGIARLIAQVAEAERHARPSSQRTSITASGKKSVAMRDGHFGPGAHFGDRISIRRGIGIGAVLLLLTVAAGAALYYVPISRYQKQVLAACQQMHAVTSASHGEAVYLSPSIGASTNPADMVHLNKKTYLRVMNNRLDDLRTSFTALDRLSVPGSLSDDKEASDAAFASYETQEQKSIAVAKSRLRHGMTMSQAEVAGVDFDGSSSARVRLNSAMSKLAGEQCDAIAVTVIA
jgi:hypothetical protein